MPTLLAGSLMMSTAAMGCGDEDDTERKKQDANTSPVTSPDGSVEDAAEPADALVADAGVDAETAPLDGAVDAAEPDAGDGGCTPGVGSCPPVDPLAPFKLNCAQLPTSTACHGGPREVLLVTEDSGLIAMFDPGDGRFLGYFKRPAATFHKEGTADFLLAEQGPDQCIWTVSEDNEASVQRWNADGTFRDVPLAPHYFPVQSGPDDPALQDTTALAFTRDRVYVASQYGDPFPRVTRWNLDGSFDGIALEGEYSMSSLLVLGDGSLVYADNDTNRVARIPAGGGEHKPVLGALDWPGQIFYAGDGGLLVADISLGEPVYKVDIATGMATTIYPNTPSIQNKYGIAALANGKWLLSGGEFYVSVLDPTSKNPAGQYVQVWDDPAVDSVNFRYVGRACLSEEFVASRAPTPPNDTCLAAPDGPVILAEDFEGTAEYEGTGTARHYKSFYDRGAAGVASSIDQTGGFAGSRGLRIAGAGTLPSSDPQRPNTNKTGVYTALSASQPKYVSYQVKVGVAGQQSLGFFALQNAAANTSQYDRLAGAYYYNGFVRGLESNASVVKPADAWLKIELRNIDWTKRTYDLYVDCKRVAEGINLPEGYGDSIDMLDIYNYSTSPTAGTVAWFDDILIK